MFMVFAYLSYNLLWSQNTTRLIFSKTKKIKEHESLNIEYIWPDSIAKSADNSELGISYINNIIITDIGLHE